MVDARDDVPAEPADPRTTDAEPRAEQSFGSLAKHMGNTPVAPAHGIAAIALDMSLKYYDIATVQEGALYQQYKLEGKNMSALHLDMVLETATKIEAWLLGASERIAKIVVEALAVAVEDEPPETASETAPNAPPASASPEENLP